MVTHNWSVQELPDNDAVADMYELAVEVGLP